MSLQIAYFALSLLTVILILLGANRVIKKTHPNDAAAQKKYFLMVLIPLLLWHLYVFLVARTGFFTNYEFPPRFVLFLILPLFAFTGIFLYLSRHKQWIKNVPEPWLVYYQTFRIGIESLFLFSVSAGILHSQVTLEGYNYDMIFAMTAPIVGYLAYSKKIFSRKIVKYWNFLGLAVIASIIFLFISTNFLPELYGSKVSLMPQGIGYYPYILVAGFLMPSAVFMHVLSIVVLSRKS